MSQPTSANPRQRMLAMFSLILAGEAVFIPPFHLSRYFKTSTLATYNIDEYELGQLGAVYGLTAMISYLLGGPLADRFSPRKLLAVSLVATGLGSLYMGTFPSLAGLYGVFAFWGASTILLFWAPLIRATREWGGVRQQGWAFGMLDGGRGLVAAVVAALAAELFAAREANAAARSATENFAHDANTLTILLSFYAAVCFVAALFAWLFVPDSPDATADPLGEVPTISLARRLWGVARLPSVWCQAVVIFSAYCAYKIFGYYGLYSEDAYGFTPAESARATAWLSFLRIGSAIAAGWIADRSLGIALSVAIGFAMLGASYLGFLLLPIDPGFARLMLANMALGCVAMYGLRGIYFALLESSHTPRALTGSAVGVISFIGFVPDIIVPPFAGRVIRDARASGDVLSGYHLLYWILAGLSLAGLLAALWLRRMGQEPADSSDSEKTV